jgi:hypothetical protein
VPHSVPAGSNAERADTRRSPFFQNTRGGQGRDETVTAGTRGSHDARCLSLPTKPIAGEGANRRRGEISHAADRGHHANQTRSRFRPREKGTEILYRCQQDFCSKFSVGA